MEVFTTPEIAFVGEQDGAVEQQLKALLSAMFSGDRRVRRAYLARARYDGHSPMVVLGLMTDTGLDDEAMVRKISEAFA